MGHAEFTIALRIEVDTLLFAQLAYQVDCLEPVAVVGAGRFVAKRILELGQA